MDITWLMEPDGWIVLLMLVIAFAPVPSIFTTSWKILIECIYRLADDLIYAHGRVLEDIGSEMWNIGSADRSADKEQLTEEKHPIDDGETCSDVAHATPGFEYDTEKACCIALPDSPTSVVSDIDEMNTDTQKDAEEIFDMDHTRPLSSAGDSIDEVDLAASSDVYTDETVVSDDTPLMASNTDVASSPALVGDKDGEDEVIAVASPHAVPSSILLENSELVGGIQEVDVSATDAGQISPSTDSDSTDALSTTSTISSAPSDTLAEKTIQGKDTQRSLTSTNPSPEVIPTAEDNTNEVTTSTTRSSDPSNAPPEIPAQEEDTQAFTTPTPK